VTERHFIFPLGTVLFPGGVLPLRIFEQRYIEMTKVCLRESLPFGVCLIREGTEVGAPASPERIGCLATIESWEMPQLGMFHLTARGGERFRIETTEVAANGLMSGLVERLGGDSPGGTVDEACRCMLRTLIERIGAARFPAPIALDDPSWVGFRLAEILPLTARLRQELLELTDSMARLARLRILLAERGLIIPGSAAG
jgi:uncharacterized protein